MLQKENQDTNQHVVFIGVAGFPLGLADIERITLMGRALHFKGCKVTVICRKGVWKKSEQTNFNTQGNHEGIKYIYTSKSVYRPIGFINRNVQKLVGLYRELLYLRDLKKQNKIDLAILSDMKVIHAVRYLIYAVILDFPIVVNLVEMASSIQHRSGFFTKVNDLLYDRWIIKFFDGALPISDKLMDFFQSKSPCKPCLKLPILCDFEKFNIEKKKIKEPYFLYCGSIKYKEVRNFVIDSYKGASINSRTKLYMIISGGNEVETEQLEKEINSLFDTRAIKIFSNIPYEKLVQLYVNAIALLIPLRCTIQDTARFPHKIGEYLATGNPVITTDVGEIKNYFTESETALIAAEYATDLFGKKMEFVLNYPDKAKVIGSKGKDLGLKEFDYKVHGARLHKFLQEF